MLSSIHYRISYTPTVPSKQIMNSLYDTISLWESNEISDTTENIMNNVIANVDVKTSIKTYDCNVCNYHTTIKSNYTKHCNTKKHARNIGLDNSSNEKVHACICGNQYKHRQSLYVHRKKCSMLTEGTGITISNSQE